MFTEQQRNAYQSIQAPPELREKILGKKKTKRHIPAYIGTALAACLVLAIGVGSFLSGGNPEIKCYGQKLDSSIVYYDVSPASEMRSASVLSVPVELELSGESEIFVDQGCLIREGETVGNQVSADSDLTLTWQVSKNKENFPCEMTIIHEEDVTTISLNYEDTKITITKKGD